MHRLKTIISSLRPNPEQSLNTILIEKQKILHNLALLKKCNHDNPVFPVLKSNAYGHGIKEISTILKDTDVPYICVDSYPEYQIVKAYARKKVLIMGETLPENYIFYDPKRATPVIWTINSLKALIATGKKRTIHLFLNTGMNREGIQEQDLGLFLNILNQSKNITLEGVMSHYANADETDNTFNTKQQETFKHLYQIIISHNTQSSELLKYHHIANSAGIVKTNDPFFNAARAGIALYGYNPLESSDIFFNHYNTLQPALSITSTITAIQHIKQGEIVSYGGKRIAPKETTIAIVPFGYYEGLTRSLTNNRMYSKENIYFPQVGRICMNISCCEINTHSMKIGDQITLVSSNKNNHNTIHQFAQKTGTIHYEVLVKLNEKIKRKIK